MAETEQHVLLFPFMAQGHITPFVSLARLLEHKTNFIITLVNTPGNIPAIRSALPHQSTIRLAALPFDCQDHGLPPNSDNTDALAFPLVLRLFEASVSLQPHFEQLISEISAATGGRPPLLIVSDFFFGWTVEVASRLGVFHAVFVTCGAYGSALNFGTWIHLPHTRTDSENFGIPGLPDSVRVHRSQLAPSLIAVDGSDSFSRFLRPQLTLALRSDGTLFNTAEDLDRVGLEYYRQMTGRPVWAIGPLEIQSRIMKQPGISIGDCASWLDLHPPSSVLFVSFGSQNTISITQMMELAAALEESGRAFVWVVRPPLGFDVNGEFRSEWLPEGFEERTRERRRGILVRRWAPQVAILGHRSTGAFLSHCGWNSVVESLSHGVPLIGWPLSAEQFQNAEMLERELEVCVEVARGNEVEIEKGQVKKAIEAVMGEEKGEKMRRRALEIRDIIKAATRDDDDCKGSSVKAMEAFVDTIGSSRGKQIPNLTL